MNKQVLLRNKLASQNEKLVHKVVHRMSATCREPYEDLFQIGYIGLLKAAERYIPDSGNAFSSFAVPYIQGEIQHYLRDQWQAIKIPRSHLETKAKVRRLQKHLASMGRNMSLEEIATGLGVSKSQWQEINVANSNILLSLDEMLYEPIHAEEPEEAEETKLVIAGLLSLKNKYKHAITERFLRDKSIKKIAKSQKESPEQIQAYIKLGLMRLQVILKEKKI
jgi:RNA polymerase sigma-B factor